jgi:hypothetical protein
MSDLYKSEFQKAFKEAFIPLSEEDLMIIDHAVDISERIAKIEGFSSNISSVHENKDSIAFRYTISYQNQSALFTLTADKSKFAKAHPVFSISNFGTFDKKEVALNTPEEINQLLISIIGLLGTQFGEARRAKTFSDAIERRRLMQSLPEFVFNKS